MHPAVVGQLAPRSAREIKRVADTANALAVCGWPIDPAAAHIRKSNQVGREIAAVDGGYVARVQRPQIARVIPIVKMTAKLLEPGHGRERRLHPFGEVEGSQPAKVAGAGCG